MPRRRERHASRRPAFAQPHGRGQPRRLVEDAEPLRDRGTVRVGVGQQRADTRARQLVGHGRPPPRYDPARPVGPHTATTVPAPGCCVGRRRRHRGGGCRRHHRCEHLGSGTWPPRARRRPPAPSTSAGTPRSASRTASASDSATPTIRTPPSCRRATAPASRRCSPAASTATADGPTLAAASRSARSRHRRASATPAAGRSRAASSAASYGRPVTASSTGTRPAVTARPHPPGPRHRTGRPRRGRAPLRPGRRARPSRPRSGRAGLLRNRRRRRPSLPPAPGGTSDAASSGRHVHVDSVAAVEPGRQMAGLHRHRQQVRRRAARRRRRPGGSSSPAATARCSARPTTGVPPSR